MKYRSKQLADRKKRLRTLKVSLIAILIFGFIIGLSYLSKIDSLTVSKITIQPVEFIDSQLVEDSVRESISGNYLFMFARSNASLIPRVEIRSNILNNNPSAKGVILKVKVLDELIVEILEYEAVAKWCGVNPENALSQCYLINKEGILFAVENVMEEKNVIKTFGVFESEEDILLQQYLPEDVFDNLVAFTKFLPQIGINAVHIDTTDQETFAVQTADGPYLLVEKHDEAIDSLNNLKTVIETEELNDVQFSNLEYIDLRFGNKVYYKIK